jgi:hypothetical protein
MLLTKSLRSRSQGGTERKIIAFITDYALAEKIMDYLRLTVLVKNPSLQPKSLSSSHSWPPRVMTDSPAYHIIFPENEVVVYLIFIPPDAFLFELFFFFGFFSC